MYVSKPWGTDSWLMGGARSIDPIHNSTHCCPRLLRDLGMLTNETTSSSRCVYWYVLCVCV